MYRSFVSGHKSLCLLRRGAESVAVALLVGCAAFPAGAQTASAPRAVIIDTDPGTDDAMAILLAFNSPEIDVRAFTVVPGNVTGAQALENALRLVSLAGRCQIRSEEHTSELQSKSNLVSRLLLEK